MNGRAYILATVFWALATVVHAQGSEGSEPLPKVLPNPSAALNCNSQKIMVRILISELSGGI